MIYAINISDPNVFKPAIFSNFSTLINLILPLATAGAALLFLVMFFSAAFKILSHGDSPEEIKKAQNTIAFAVLGLIVVIVSFLAVNLIGKMLGVTNILPQ
ncbi:MAG: hypothetical protein ACK4FL_01345 [Microgenomates group bacterium]